MHLGRPNGAWMWVEDQIEKITRSKANCFNVIAISDIGLMISTTMVAAIGEGTAFDHERDFAVWVGLIPRQ